MLYQIFKCYFNFNCSKNTHNIQSSSLGQRVTSQRNKQQPWTLNRWSRWASSRSQSGRRRTSRASAVSSCWSARTSWRGASARSAPSRWRTDRKSHTQCYGPPHSVSLFSFSPFLLLFTFSSSALPFCPQMLAVLDMLLSICHSVIVLLWGVKVLRYI